ncbi:uncharacterized protein LOC129285117 [Prosopis cineraria]|uniref:uncharacterized protein LOC129285117 n=1 Tax=Prosopis cineraria TaxID=364024 RepID=UPI00241038BF|nr:uncharacterized protein LOC129285117 [Prosopis cineraria]
MKGMEHSSSHHATNLDQQLIQEEPSDLKILAIPAMDSRSMSDNSFKLLESFSPVSVLPDHSSHPFSTKKKDLTEDSSLIMMLPKRKRSIRKMRKPKSLPELEMEEVEGFTDLGFVFTEADSNSSLASIIPGLKRLGKEKEDDEVDESSIHQRPYLSETWKFLERKKKLEEPLLNWRLPEDTRNEAIMKDNLKSWAQTVASLFN